MRKQKIRIKAVGDHAEASLEVTLVTKEYLTISELRRERKRLADQLLEGLHRFGFYRQDCSAK